ncbi:MAG: OsmC family protein [Patescibacteria group bacterium]|nr:OsmC family protein [Patescibacteria group bacterium]
MEGITKGNKRFTHKIVVTWNEEKKVFLCSFDKQTVEIVASPESKKHEGMWTPEELFVASIEGFIKDAFVDFAKKDGFEFLSYESEADWVVEKVEDKLMFTEIKIWPQIAVASSGQIGKANELIELTVKNCFISNFITCKVSVYPEIKIGLKDGRLY